jgi:hypothetical protein
MIIVVSLPFLVPDAMEGARTFRASGCYPWCGLWPSLPFVSFPDRLTAKGRLLRVRSGHAEVEVQ